MYSDSVVDVDMEVCLRGLQEITDRPRKGRRVSKQASSVICIGITSKKLKVLQGLPGRIAFNPPFCR